MNGVKKSPQNHHKITTKSLKNHPKITLESLKNHPKITQKVTQNVTGIYEQFSILYRVAVWSGSMEW